MKQKNRPVAKQLHATKNSVVNSPAKFREVLRHYFCRYDIIILFIVLFIAYNTATGIGLTSSDVVPASILPIELITNHNVYLDVFTSSFSNPDVSYAFPFVHGHYVSLFPIVTPVLVTPIYAISYFLSTLFGIVPFGSNDFYILAKSAASVIAALAGVLVYLSGKELFSKRVAILTTFLFAFATSTWSVSSRALWQQGTVELLLIALIYLIIKNEKKESLVYIVLL